MLGSEKDSTVAQWIVEKISVMIHSLKNLDLDKLLAYSS